MGKLLIVFDTGSHASKVGMLGSGGNPELMISVFLHPKRCDYWHVPPWFELLGTEHRASCMPGKHSAN